MVCAGGRGAIGETIEKSLSSPSPDDDEENEGEGGSCSMSAGAVAPRGGEVATAATLLCGTGVAGLSALVPLPGIKGAVVSKLFRVGVAGFPRDDG